MCVSLPEIAAEESEIAMSEENKKKVEEETGHRCM